MYCIENAKYHSSNFHGLMELAPNCHECSCFRCCPTRLDPLPHFTSHTASAPSVVKVGSTLKLHLCRCVCIQGYSSSRNIISIPVTSKSSFLEDRSLVCFFKYRYIDFFKKNWKRAFNNSLLWEWGTEVMQSEVLRASNCWSVACRGNLVL